MSRLPLAIAITAATLVAACGSPSVKTLAVPAVPFTFEYPADFREATDASLRAAHALAVVGPGPDSYLAVRRNGTAMSITALERQAARALGGSILRHARETHSGLPMVVVEVADSGGKALGLRSAIYGFSLGNSSWLLECHSTHDQRATLTAACRQALASIKPRG